MPGLVESETSFGISMIIDDDGNLCPSLNSSGITGTDFQLEEKYWKMKILYSAVESVLFSPSETEKFTPEVLHRLRRAFHSDGMSGEEDDEDEVLEKVTISADDKNILQTLVSRKIKEMSGSLTKTISDLLISSSSGGLDRRATKFDDSLQEVVHILQNRKEDEHELDKEIQKLEIVQQEETKIFENSLTEMKLDLENLMRKALLHKDPQLLNKKLEALQFRCDILTKKVEILKKKQLQGENPPDVSAKVRTTKVLLATAIDELRKEISSKEAFLQQYDSLTPDVLELLAELRSTEEAIERQEWIKRKLVGFNESDPEISFDF